MRTAVSSTKRDLDHPTARRPTTLGSSLRWCDEFESNSLISVFEMATSKPSLLRRQEPSGVR